MTEALQHLPASDLVPGALTRVDVLRAGQRAWREAATQRDQEGCEFVPALIG
ncbi:hypothetical protein [Streptomyces sp. NPDC005773]|uniref:hypothetical protein n=1 Tax=Streptomyces sp. NPDC005773 TaxID=3364727 RepID=UPI0036C8383D